MPNDDGFYHGYNETDSYDAEKVRKRSEYDANVSNIMEQYNAELLNQKTPTFLEKVGIPKLGMRDALDKKKIELLVDEITPEQFELKKAEYLAKADQIKYNRSKGGGYSNGGYSQYDFVGGNSPNVNNSENDNFSYYTSYEQDDNIDDGNYSDPVSAYYPQKKIAGEKDGARIFMPLMIIGAISVLITVISLISGIVLNSQSKQLIASADKVAGTVSYTNRPQSSYLSVSTIHYTYTYNGKEHKGSERLTFSQANSLGLAKLTTHGQAVTVYVDPDNPSSSVLAEKPVFQRGAVGIIGSVLGIAVLTTGIVLWLGFRNGKFLIVEENGRKKLTRA